MNLQEKKAKLMVELNLKESIRCKKAKILGVYNIGE